MSEPHEHDEVAAAPPAPQTPDPEPPAGSTAAYIKAAHWRTLQPLVMLSYRAFVSSYHQDHMNAARLGRPVEYSPLTRELAFALHALHNGRHTYTEIHAVVAN